MYITHQTLVFFLTFLLILNSTVLNGQTNKRVTNSVNHNLVVCSQPLSLWFLQQVRTGPTVPVLNGVLSISQLPSLFVYYSHACVWEWLLKTRTCSEDHFCALTHTDVLIVWGCSSCCSQSVCHHLPHPAGQWPWDSFISCVFCYNGAGVLFCLGLLSQCTEPAAPLWRESLL